MKYTSKQNRLIKNSNTIEVEIGLNDTKKAIELLYSQYRFSIQTCVQELVSNAFDAMFEANKQDTPIQVQLPNELNDNTFFVRDFGNSMTDDTVKNVYMRVNASTKSKSNKVIGGFGIGSKTPWAYTDTFILTTFLDNIETQYLLVKGRSTVSIIHKGKTNEVNGTKVTFQARSNDKEYFERAFKRIAICAKIKPLVNFKGSLDFDQTNVINNTISIVKSDMLDNLGIYFNMGGVLYKTNRHREYGDSYDTVYKALNSSTLIINIPIGSLSPLQTREGLFTDQEQGHNNKIMIKSVLKKVNVWLDEYITNELNKCNSVESVIELHKNSLFKINKSFKIDGLSLQHRGIDLQTNGKISTITRNSKRSRYYGKNLTARNDSNSFISYDDINKLTAYFCEESPNKARLCSRLKDITLNDDVIVLEKNKLDLNVYNTLKKVLKATDVMQIDIPKTIRSSSNRSYSVDKNKIATYYHDGKRSHVDLWLDKDYSDRKIVVIEKGRHNQFKNDMFTSLGYSTTYVTGTKMNKLLSKDGFYSESEAMNMKELAKIYGKSLAQKQFKYKLDIRNSKLLSKCLSDNKNKLINVFDNAISFSYAQNELKEKLIKEYPNVIEQSFKKASKQYYRGYQLAKKVPLIRSINDYKLNEQGLKDLTEYVTQKVGV